MDTHTKDFSGKAFYQHLGDHKLTGSSCESCEALYVPPRPMCPGCYGADMTMQEIGGTGVLIGFITVHIAPTAMIAAGYDRKNPYCAGVVRLAEGPAISAQIVGVDPTKPEDIKVGMPLRMTFVERDEGEQAGTYLAFEPAD